MGLSWLWDFLDEKYLSISSSNDARNRIKTKV